MEQYGCEHYKDQCNIPVCFTDRHHPDWPKDAYGDNLSRQYRELRVMPNICRWLHNQWHLQDPPEKPSIEEMKQFIIDLETG